MKKKLFALLIVQICIVFVARVYYFRVISLVQEFFKTFFPIFLIIFVFLFSLFVLLVLFRKFDENIGIINPKVYLILGLIITLISSGVNRFYYGESIVPFSKVSVLLIYMPTYMGACTAVCLSFVLAAKLDRANKSMLTNNRLIIF